MRVHNPPASEGGKKMNKKFSRFFLVFFMAIVILFDKVQVVKAASYGLVLTLYSNSNNKKDMGHAWIGITNNTISIAHVGPYLIKQGESVYIDARGDGDRPFVISQTDHKGSFNGGTFINYVGVASSVYKNFAYVSKDITFEDLDMIFYKMKNYKTYDLVANNCTHFAKSIWNGVKNKSKSIKKSFTGVEAPQSLKKYIIDKMGGKTGTTLNSTSCYYFVSPLGHLVPSKIADVSGFQGKRNGSKASFSWQKLQTDQYDITGYEIKYVGNKSKKEKNIKVSANSSSASISGLNIYAFQIHAVCDYSSERNGACNYGDFSSPVILKGKNVKITLSKTKASVTAGSSFTLKATVSGTSKKVTWRSSNSKIAKVKNGKVTGIKSGTVKITATVDGKKAVCTITVKDNWYQKVLQSSVPYKVKGAFDNKTYTIYRSHLDKYRLVDINKDGVKELLLYKHPEVAVFTYYKGKVVPLTYAGYARGVYLKGKYFTLQHGTSSENTCYTYTLKNGKLAKIGEYFHTTSSAYPVPIYKINGKDCSKATFFKTYNKYMQDFQYLS